MRSSRSPCRSISTTCSGDRCSPVRVSEPASGAERLVAIVRAIVTVPFAYVVLLAAGNDRLGSLFFSSAWPSGRRRAGSRSARGGDADGPRCGIRLLPHLYALPQLRVRGLRLRSRLVVRRPRSALASTGHDAERVVSHRLRDSRRRPDRRRCSSASARSPPGRRRTGHRGARRSIRTRLYRARRPDRSGTRSARSARPARGSWCGVGRPSSTATTTGFRRAGTSTRGSSSPTSKMETYRRRMEQEISSRPPQCVVEAIGPAFFGEYGPDKRIVRLLPGIAGVLARCYTARTAEPTPGNPLRYYVLRDACRASSTPG